jgi:acetyl-CoA acyltransferase
MAEAYICDYIRTPIGRFGGSLSSVRADDLGAIPLKALMQRNASVDWQAVDDVIFGCANQAGEDNRNVARMSLLLAGMPRGRARHDHQPPVRLRHGCGHQCRARDPRRRGRTDDCRRRREHVARAVRHGQGRNAFSRAAEIHDTTIGWRFINPLMKAAVRRRFDAGDRRECRRLQGAAARGPGRLRTPAQQNKAAAAHRQRASRARDRPRRHPAAQG